MKNRSRIKFATYAVASAAVVISTIMPVSIAAAAEMPTISVQIESIRKLAADAVALGALEQAEAQPMISALLGNMIHNPSLDGIDSTKPIDVYLFFPEGNPDDASMAMVLTVTDSGKAHRDAVTHILGGTAKQTGSITEFTGPGGNEKLYVAVEGKKCVMSEKRGPVRMTRELIAAGKLGSKVYLGLRGTVRLSLNVKQLVPFLKETAEKQAAAIKQAGIKAQPGMPDPAVAQEANMDLIIELIENMNTVSASLRMTKDALSIFSRIDPVPGSELAKTWAASKAPSAQYLSLCPEDAYVAFAMSGIDDMLAQMTGPYAKMMTQTYASMGKADSGDVFKKMMTDMEELYAGDMALAVVPGADGKGMGFMEWFELVDPVKAKTIIDAMMADYNKNMAELSGGLKLIIGKERKYKNVTVSSYSYEIDASNPQAAMMPGFIANMKWEMAITGKHLLYTLGESELMDRAIDRLKAKASTPIQATAKFKRVIPNVKIAPTSVYRYSLVSLAREALMMMPNANEALVGPVPKDSAGIAGYTLVRDDNLLAVTYVSMEEINGFKELKPIAMGLLPMLMMGGGMGMNQGMHGGAMPPPQQMNCGDNLMMIDFAKQSVAESDLLKTGDTVDEGDTELYIGPMPKCPEGGKYTIGTVGTAPSCSVPGHTMQ